MIEIPEWVRPDMADRIQQGAYEPQLNRLTQLLLDAPMNVTGFRTAEDLWLHGIFDALCSVQEIDMSLVHEAVDVGSGGGFPGMVLAILFPDIEWVLIESRVKRAEYLELMGGALDLENVTVFAERAEDMVQSDASWREAAELVTARAVGPLSVAAELSVPFIRVDGFGIFPKGASQAADEVRVAKSLCKKLGAEVAKISDPYGVNQNSRIITLKKIHPTPVVYPRKARYLGEHN